MSSFLIIILSISRFSPATLSARRLMYWQVYLHKTVVGIMTNPSGANFTPSFLRMTPSKVDGIRVS